MQVAAAYERLLEPEEEFDMDDFDMEDALGMLFALCVAAGRRVVHCAKL
jgi:hypothetical protein